MDFKACLKPFCKVANKHGVGANQSEFKFDENLKKNITRAKYFVSTSFLSKCSQQTFSISNALNHSAFVTLFFKEVEQDSKFLNEVFVFADFRFFPKRHCQGVY